MSASKREAHLKQLFTQHFKRLVPHYVVQRFVSRGSPDRSITGSGRTTHWEFKHGTPEFEAPGDQQLMCLRLAVQGHCRYVVWQEDKAGNKKTLILHPNHLKDMLPEAFCPGFDMRWLVERIREAHRA